MAVENIRTTGRGAGPNPMAGRIYPTFAASAGLLLMRVPVGVLFILAGIGKFSIKPDGLQTFVSANLPDATRFMSESMGRTYLQSLPWIEIGLGALLVVGLFGRVVAFLLSIVLLSIVVAKTVDFGSLLADKNLILMGLTMGLAFTGMGLLSVDGMPFGPKRRIRVTEEYVEPLGG